MIKLLEKKDCCGCYACLNSCPTSCIEMQEDMEGFVYPTIDEEKCINCGLCEKVCPVLQVQQPHIPLSVYAAKAQSVDIREKSSSGGIFTLLAERVIADKGVVFGACFNEQYEVVHHYTSTQEGLSAFRGSKYVQSKIGDTYKKVETFLKSGNKVLFSGTPCQVRGLHLYLKKKYTNLLTVDFICHGVPSPKVWRTYLTELMEIVSTNTISQINFRDKKSGWLNFGFSFDLSHKHHILHLSEPKYINLYLRGFLHDLYIRPSCHSCPTRSLTSGSDITLGDYWGVRKILPAFMDDKGISAVLINTELGLHTFESLPCDVQVTTYEDVLKGNQSLEKSHPVSAKRETFFSLLDKRSFSSLIKELTDMSLKERLKWRIQYLRLKLEKLKC